MHKLLLVEDNEINREMLSRRLQSRGYHVICAVNGADGVAKTLSEQPHLVLMDVNLPVIDGLTASTQLKQNPQTKHIPIIALTADAMSVGHETAINAGCDDYNTKPIDLPRLLGKIETLLEKYQNSTAENPQNLDSCSDTRMQRALLSYLRHELCTPINAIIGYSEILLDELRGKSDSQLYADLEKIHLCGNQMLTLTDTIFHPHQHKVGQSNLNLQEFGANVRLELLTPLSTAMGYCDILLEEAPGEMIADLDKIHRATQNLLELVNDIINVAQQQLQIIDTNNLNSTCDRNHQALPLESQSMALIESAVSTIRSLESNNDGYTDSHTVHGEKILVVDDNQINCDLLSRQLQRQGYTVAIANNGEQALRILKAMPYDLILLDIIMPEVGGLEILHRIKTHAEWQHIPVIMISGLDEIDSVVRCVEMGAEDYLSKPFKPVLLRAKIAACLEKKRLREQQALLVAQKLIAEATPVPILITRLEDGKILYANTEATVKFGLSMDELLNRPIQDFYCQPEQHQQLVEILSHNQLQIHRQEFQCHRADGSTFWVRGSFQSLTFQQEKTILSALSDISDFRAELRLRQQAEDALRIAEEKYRSIFENAIEGIFQSTPDGRFLNINPAMARLFGYESPETMLSTVTDISQQIYVDQEKYHEFRHLILETGEVTNFEYQAYNRDRNIIWLSESSRIVRNAQGELLYYEGIVEDISDRKLREAALERQLEELKIEIDQNKIALQVSEITNSDYFQELQANAQQIKTDFYGHNTQTATASRILLVEDNEMNRDMLTRRLQRHGYEILIAVDGNEGISQAIAQKPDIILMDMSLPVIDGWEATRQLKANPDTQAIPIIALTAHAMAGDREKAIASGCDDYDTKPVEMPRLLGKISNLLSVASR